MKKQYIQPAIAVVRIATTKMIAASPTGGGVSEEKLGSGVSALSRDGGYWDDED